jgi:RNA polymerase sigma-70 factor (ECF subfamily)
MAESHRKTPVDVADNGGADELLARQFSAGDNAAFERIVRQNSTEIAALANRLLGWCGDVEDVVQDIFFSAFQARKKFKGNCSIRTWLFTITLNKCRTRRYKRMLRQKSFSKLAQKDPKAHAGSDQRLVESETFEKVRDAVKALPVKYREPIVLRYLQELAIDDIAEILALSRNAVEVRLTRARTMLKQDLAGLIED